MPLSGAREGRREGGNRKEGGRGRGERKGERRREREVGKGGRGRPNINMAISRYMILTFCALATVYAKYAGLWGGRYTTVQADGAL